MIQPEYLVSVERGKTLRERVLSCLEGLGGIRELVPPGKRVLVKPNLVIDRPHSSGAITNPALLDVLLDELQKTAPRELIVGEGSAAHYSTERAFRVSGVDRVAKKHGARLVNFQKDAYEEVPVPQGKELERVEVARTVLEADILVNVPVLKMHCQTRVTIGLKNLKGCISDDEKRRFHRLDLDQCIADLNTVIPVHLVVVDATLCSFAWECGGDAVRLDTVLAGTNPVAVDTAAAPLLGYHPGEIRHIALSARHGLGPCDSEAVRVLHREKLQEITLPEGVSCGVQYRVPGLTVVEKGACTPCLAGLLAAMRRLDREGVSLRGTVLLGQKLDRGDMETAEREKGATIGVGSCAAGLVGREKALIGCPPEGWQIYDLLKKSAH